MKIRLPYLMALTLGALGIFYGPSSQGLNASPSASITTLDERHFDLASSGNATLVSFYSPDCPISRRDAANLRALHQQFKNDAVEIIAVAMPYDTTDGISDFSEEHEVQYNIAHDTDGSIADAFPNVRFTPTSFLIDNDGKIIWRHTGQMRLQEISDKVAGTIAR